MRLIVAVAVLALAGLVAPLRAAPPIYKAEVVHVYPHDRSAFTEGLFYLNGAFYESTGFEGRSTIRKVDVATGVSTQEIHLPAQYFGEGIAPWKSHLISVTWKSQIGFVFDRETFRVEREFHIDGEGWALTEDGKQLILSDGTADLRLLDPDTFQETQRLRVTLDGKPLGYLNELEWVHGEILANVWHTNWIVRIDPRTGNVVGQIDIGGLIGPADQVVSVDVGPNGIAYDPAGDRLFVTGKNWPKMFEIRLRAIQ
jgi:glutaminyl-peptide cyclotransferase